MDHMIAAFKGLLTSRSRGSPKRKYPHQPCKFVPWKCRVRERQSNGIWWRGAGRDQTKASLPSLVIYTVNIRFLLKTTYCYHPSSTARYPCNPLGIVQYMALVKLCYSLLCSAEQTNAVRSCLSVCKLTSTVILLLGPRVVGPALVGSRVLYIRECLPHSLSHQLRNTLCFIDVHF